MIMAAVGMGMTLLGASANKKAAAKSMQAQATADTAGRRATANSMIASVHSQNAKVDEMKRSVELIGIQGKADAVMRKESYNEMMATSMVMGAASGRALNEGSTDAIFNKSQSDYMWDQMWNKNNQEISEAAMYQDMENIYQAGATSLMLGGEQLGVDRLRSMAGQESQAAAMQTSFNNTMTGMVNSYASSYGDTLFGKGL